MAEDKKAADTPGSDALKVQTFTLILPDMPAQIAALVGDALSMVPVDQIAQHGRNLRLVAAQEMKHQAARRIIVPGKGVQ